MRKSKEKRPKSQNMGKSKEKVQEISTETEMKRKAQLNLDELESQNESYDEENQLTKVKIGKIPYGWYDEFKHFGYDNKLNPVEKQKTLGKIEEFIKKSQNKDWWRTIRDQLNGKQIVLSDEQLNMIDRIRSGKMASKAVATAEYNISFQHNDPFPVHAHPPKKSNFKPSKWQQMKVNKILDGLLSGRIKWNPQSQKNQDEDLYDVWASGSMPERGVINIAPMKQKLPGHNQSYNPPKQFLLTPEELEEWKELDEQDRPFNFIPTAVDKLRKIPFYDNLIQQRFQRCLDLYLCPRVKKKKLNIDPDNFIPKLPDPKTLKPFPTSMMIIYNGHEAPVISLAVSPTGQFLATGDESGLICIWQSLSSRKLYEKKFEQPIFSIDWSASNMIAFSHGQTVQIMLWRLNKQLRKKGQSILEQGEKLNKGSWSWYETSSSEYSQGYRIKLQFDNDITHVEFEKSKGDYFVTVCPDHEKKNEVISIHRITTAGSQKNFIKGSGKFLRVCFYPNKPQILILTNKSVILFSLVKLQKLKSLQITGNTSYCMAVHPLGDYIVVGTQNHKLLCYDLNLQTKPFKTMQYHDKGVTSVSLHKQYPLMASSSNDGTIHIFHFKVETEIITDPVILPLKVLKGHVSTNVDGVKAIKFHPKQPWIFSIGHDNKVFLWG